MSETSDRGPLDGVRILDLATMLAAPFAATLCGDLGADVVKVELPDGSDPLRTLSPVKGEHALHWKVTNRGKRGVTLDVRKPEGRDVLLEMLRNFDVLVENFRAGTLEKWGLDIPTLHRANPRLIVLRLTGFGQTGPARSRPGYARIFEAMSGFTNLAGERDGPPMHMNYPIGDSLAGLFGAFSIAAELVRLKADPSALGVEIDLSATEALMRLLEPLPVEYEQLGFARTRSGNLAGYTAPSNLFRSGDGVHFTLVASSEVTFRRLCNVIGATELPLDSRYASNPARVQHAQALSDILAKWFGDHVYADIAARLDLAQVPFSKIYDVADVMADPQFIARQAIIRLPDRDLESVPAPCIVPRVAGRTLPTPRTGPSVGEHSDEVYAEHGIDGERLSRLRADGVI